MTRQTCIPLTFIVLTLATAIGCNNKDRTEILLGMATDLAAPSPLASVEMQIFDVQGTSNGALVADQTLPISGTVNEVYELPATFAVYSANGSGQRFRAVLTATGDTGATLVVRSAVMNLVPEKTLFVRLGVVSACQGMANTCGDGQTCIEGQCQTEDVDSALLPEYVPGMENQVECVDGTNFVDTSTGQPLTIAGTSCAAGSCLEGVCLAPAKDDGTGGGGSLGVGTSGSGGTAGGGSLGTSGSGGTAGGTSIGPGAGGAGTGTGTGGNNVGSGAGGVGGGGTSNTGTAGSTVTSSCSSTSGTGTITTQFGTGVVTCDNTEYIVQNNASSATGGQTILYGPGPVFRVQLQNGSSTTSSPADFPSVFIGANARGNTGSTSMLPRPVGQIAPAGLMTNLTWAANGATGSYSAGYDLWFSATATGDQNAPTPTGGELLVWLNAPASNQPVGTMVSTVTIEGRTWNVWYGTNQSTGKPCVSYVAPTSIGSLSDTLGDFVQDALSRGYVQTSWYLSNIFAGFEIWNGGAGLAITDFSVNVP